MTSLLVLFLADKKGQQPSLCYPAPSLQLLHAAAGEWRRQQDDEDEELATVSNCDINNITNIIPASKKNAGTTSPFFSEPEHYIGILADELVSVLISLTYL
jgi:hypothetical protein